ncbi:MAG: lamin tail domain-containing protein [Sphingobacteriaceae bacterium]
MKNSLVFLALLCIKSAFGQVADSFNDGDFTNNPTWLGSGFLINGSLQSQTLFSAAGQTVQLVTPNSKVLNVAWEFYMQMDFDPSTSSRMRIYLVSTSQDLTIPLNGYFIQVGESLNQDSYDLYRQDGANITKIIDGPPKSRVNTSQLLARVRVTRDINGNWEILTDISGGSNFTSEGTSPTPDLKYISSSWFGVRCEYPSSTNSNKFYFDDVSIGNLNTDTEAPQLISISVIDSTSIEASFSEAVNPESALVTTNYVLTNGYNNPTEVKSTPSLNKYLLIFASSFNTNSYTLSTNNISDYNFNIQSNTNQIDFSYVKPYVAQAKEVLINEIFADPSPQIDLPSVEFVELWNTTDFPISLKSWTYSDGTSTATIGNNSIDPHEFVLLCALADVPNFTPFGKVLGLSTWPSLNNTGDHLLLKNANGKLIDEVYYADTWYKDAAKKQGGWSLELINPKALCSGIQNWGASIDVSGGSPGKSNSIYSNGLNPDPLKLLSASLLDSVTLSVSYNRFVDSSSAVVPNHYNLNNGMGQPLSAVAIAPYFTEVYLKFGAALTRGLSYTLSSTQVSDCSGVLLQAPNNSSNFYLPKKILTGDLLLSEILFNPRVGGVDFVEIYNSTDHPLDLKDIGIASADDQNKLINLKPVSALTNLIPSKAYRVLTTDTDNILTNYSVAQPNTLVKVGSLPSFNDDSGVVILVRDSIRIDQFNYSDKMHFSLLSNTEGVSLERSLFSLPANTPGNFRSAAASVGFASPGVQNSQFVEDKKSKDALTLSSPTLSPDNDGFEDVLTVLYHWELPGEVANVRIYTEQGQLVRYLIKNQSLGTEGVWIWDGLNEQAERVPIGIYILKVQVFNTNGVVKNYTKTCAVAIKLN